MPEYISVNQFSYRLGVTPRRVRTLLSQGRVRKAKKVSGVWLIPVGAKDPRKPVGRSTKHK